MGLSDVLWNGAKGLAGGIGEGIGKIAGKAADWIPSPQQYRRNKIRELTQKMLDVQHTKPFDVAKYERLRDERDRIESDALNTGS